MRRSCRSQSALLKGSRARCSTWNAAQELESEWQQRFSNWSQAFPDARETWDAAWAGRIGPWELPVFEVGDDMATRDAGKKVMQAFKHAVPTMIGGAADLVESTKTEFVGGGLFSDAGRAQHRVRHPRARDGRDRERHRACTAAA